MLPQLLVKLLAWGKFWLCGGGARRKGPASSSSLSTKLAAIPPPRVAAAPPFFAAGRALGCAVAARLRAEDLGAALSAPTLRRFGGPCVGHNRECLNGGDFNGL